MNNELAIYTLDPIYAYNFRIKFRNSDWGVTYLNSINELKEYIGINRNGVVFIDTNSGVIEEIFLYIKSNLNNFVFVYIENKSKVEMQYYANTDIILTNMENMDIVMLQIINQLKAKSEQRSKMDDSQIYNNISDVLLSFGLSPKRIGYKYLHECLEMCLHLDKSFICFKSDIYPAIARNYNVSMSAIEKSIRTSLKEAYIKFPELFNNEYFKFGHPTNNQFINFILMRIK